MQTHPQRSAVGPPRTLSENLEAALLFGEENPSLHCIVQRIGDKGFGLFLIILALPSALPVPAPGYSTPFGIVLAWISLQMIAGRTTPWLPHRALRKEVKRETASRIIGAVRRFLHYAEKWIRPRHRWIHQRAGRVFIGAITLSMSILMIFPIPLTNTAPAGVIFLIGLALSEDDGLLALFGFVLGLLALLFYSYIIYLLLTVGMEGVLRLKEWLIGLL